MSKIWLIIQREYLTRVRKKSFIIMTLLTPILLAAFMVLPAWLVSMSDETETVMVLDESGLFADKLENKKDLTYIPLQGSLEQAKFVYQETDNTALLYIPKITVDNPEGITIYSKKNTSYQTQVRLENALEKEIENQRFMASGLDRETLERIEADISLATINLSDQGEKDNNVWVTSGAGIAGAFIIYFFIFLYGVQIMRGIIEEKTNRIVEVMISSVKPFQLMMGKIIGIAAVGLTQFLLWVILSTVVVTGVQSAFGVEAAPTPAQQLAAGRAAATGEDEETGEATKDSEGAEVVASAINAFNNLNLPLIIGCFLFYFLGGYLLYGSLFGAIGAAVDNETDTQQFMFPITIPLIISFIMSYSLVLKNPDGPVSFWMSIIPFTSPIVMMVRIPFGVPAWELLLSMALLIAGFVFTTWIAARIYRVGILMYGKKVNYKELSKWLFYRV
ncbi:ABC-2 type transport system permease protein [Pontibacter ummariensis]|uniref:ABC-2 type transport system permease protein n=1 Tax=Pontibacter ummariensis TaxID=1610492 RepID=A0A239GAJ6_9BACT|nr:ABC transporter permease [Pontibacter ummariensis]PRY11570.1 ABC-2 type transport system permease protein [Pontibacter ummariensis]SNS65955.1 ABC-2 type transport system permease protein [Pontibacter ummariensis]